MTTKVNPNLVRQNFRKNLIINGNFDVWQRGTSFAAPSAGDYTTDRFLYSKAGAMVHTLSRSTDVPTYAESGIKSNYSWLIDCTTADTSLAATDYTDLAIKIEGYDYAQIAGGDATLSFWVKATKTGIHSVAFRNSDVSRSYVVEYTINTTDTWEKKVITVPLTETGGTWDYTNGTGLTISWNLASGTTYNAPSNNTWLTGNYNSSSNQVNATDSVSNDFRLAQIQFEKGDAASEFDFRHFGNEITLCQRYYQKSYAYATAPGTGTNANEVRFRLASNVVNTANLQTSISLRDGRMRADPSITLYTAGGTSGSIGESGVVRAAGVPDANSDDTSFEVTNQSGVTLTDGNYINFHYTADAEL